MTGAISKTIMLKRLPLDKCKLFVRTDSRKIKWCDCDAVLEIMQHSVERDRSSFKDIPEFVLAVSFPNRVNFDFDIAGFIGFAFECDILRGDGVYERIHFAQCDAIDGIDVTFYSPCRFKVTCSKDQYDRIVRM